MTSQSTLPHVPHRRPVRLYRAAALLGGTVVPTRKFDLQQALELIEQYRATFFDGVQQEPGGGHHPIAATVWAYRQCSIITEQ